MARNASAVAVPIQPNGEVDQAELIREEVNLSSRDGLHWHFVERAALERVDSGLRALIEANPDIDLVITVTRK